LRFPDAASVPHTEMRRKELAMTVRALIEIGHRTQVFERNRRHPLARFPWVMALRRRQLRLSAGSG
jgi:hypothetical protein